MITSQNLSPHKCTLVKSQTGGMVPADGGSISEDIGSLQGNSYHGEGTPPAVASISVRKEMQKM